MIDYELISQSIEYYDRVGFKRIETPWLVTKYVDGITRPKEAIEYHIPNKNKNLIASGEQGFLYLYLKEYLPEGKFQTVTPCFRNDSFDFTHTKYFIKNELINTVNTDKNSLLNIVNDAFNFFSQYIPEDKLKVTDEGDNSIDIKTYNDLELGSYGIRECDFLKWVYGTGCAEPRTSKLIKKNK